MPVGVGDGQGRLGGEQPQGLLVLRGELHLPLALPFLLRQVDAAHPLAPVKQRKGQEGHPGAHFYRRTHFGQAQGTQVFQQVGHPQGTVQLGQVAEVLGPARAGPQPGRLLRGHARGEEVAGNPGGVVEGDDAVAGAGEGTGRVQDALEHGLHVQVLGDAQAGLAEQGQPLPQFRYLPVSPGQLFWLYQICASPELVWNGHQNNSAVGAPRGVSKGAGGMIMPEYPNGSRKSYLMPLEIADTSY